MKSSSIRDFDREVALVSSVEPFGPRRRNSISLKKSPKHSRRTTIQAGVKSVRLTKRKDGTIPRLVAEDLEKRFSTGSVARLEVFRGLSLTVDAGEVVAIIGNSGTGKSTLLHLLGALDPVCQRPLFEDCSRPFWLMTQIWLNWDPQ